MYKITLINNNVETIVHYPDPEAPKVINPKLNIKRSQAGSLTFSITLNNPGYNLITRFITKVVCVDIRDNKEVFSGRVFTTKSGMADGGELKKEVVCEGKMNYLHDSVVESVIYEDQTPADVIPALLEYHNTQVEDYKKVQPGIIDVEDWLFFTTDFETTLEAIQKYCINENKGFLRFRTEDGINYLDYMANPPQDKISNISLGENLKSLTIDDSQVFGTRIIPVGANGLTIERVNNNKNYIEDSAAVAKCGIIYKKADYSDIDDDEMLMTECQKDLSQYTQPAGSFDVSALDLSTLANTSIDSIDTSTSVHINCPLLGVDDTYKVMEMDIDLTKPWNPKLTISNKPSKLTDTVSNIQSNSINRMATYGGVQLGYRFGIRVVSHDKSVEILINGQEGFRITKDGVQKFYIDTDGNVTLDGIQKITKNGNVIMENTYNAYGGLNNIYDTNGNLVMKLGVEAGTGANTGATLIGYNKDSSKPRFKLGIARDGDFGALELLDTNGEVGAVLYGNGTGALREDGVLNPIATQIYVLQHMNSGGES
ncbi:phage tail spike protein [Clostridium tyrobutyricum]|uniref:phage tail spike protein n=1 Tax=Clostridium tyrobutyricum TaxID=1519 RepID=UPI00241CC1C1|nr:phage tail spike protein [Clostridium tyrobutyricum]